MFLDELKIINVPDLEWVCRLRNGNLVWLPKEEVFAKIEFAWQSSFGLASGLIGLRRCWRDNDKWGFQNLESWYVKTNGLGFDGKYIMLPVEGHCPDKDPIASALLLDRIEKAVTILSSKVNTLEKTVYENYSRI